MILQSQINGPRLEPRPKPPHPGISWAEMAAREGNCPKLPGDGLIKNNRRPGREPTKLQMQVFNEIRLHGPITIADVAKRLGADRKKVQNRVHHMRARGVLVITNPGQRQGIYVVAEAS